MPPPPGRAQPAVMTTGAGDRDQVAALRRRYLIRFEEDTLRQRPLWIRIIIEFVGTFLLVTVAAGAGVINHYAGGGPGPISRAAPAVAPGLLGLFAGPISVSSMTPARTLGPDIVAGDFTGWWAYVAGDLIGAALAVGLIALVRRLPDKAEIRAAEGSRPGRVP